jgi:hypothetical protein
MQKNSSNLATKGGTFVKIDWTKVKEQSKIFNVMNGNREKV